MGHFCVKPIIRCKDNKNFFDFVQHLGREKIKIHRRCLFCELKIENGKLKISRLPSTDYRLPTFFKGLRVLRVLKAPITTITTITPFCSFCSFCSFDIPLRLTAPPLTQGRSSQKGTGLKKDTQDKRAKSDKKKSKEQHNIAPHPSLFILC